MGRAGQGRSRGGQGHWSLLVTAREVPPALPPRLAGLPGAAEAGPGSRRGKRRVSLPPPAPASSPALPPASSPPSFPPHPPCSFFPCSPSEPGAREAGGAARGEAGSPARSPTARPAQLFAAALVAAAAAAAAGVSEGAQDGPAGLTALRVPGGLGAPSRGAFLRGAGGCGALGAADPALRVSAWCWDSPGGATGARETGAPKFGCLQVPLGRTRGGCGPRLLHLPPNIGTKPRDWGGTCSPLPWGCRVRPEEVHLK